LQQHNEVEVKHFGIFLVTSLLMLACANESGKTPDVQKCGDRVCSDTELCQNDVCKTKCGERVCSDTELCQNDVCKTKCGERVCSDTELCQNDVCKTKCGERVCSDTELCQNEECKTKCGERVCSDTELCQNDVCKTKCGERVCSDTELCQNDVCKTKCGERVCSDTELCQNEECKTKCGDRVCNDTEICQNDVCEAATDPRSCGNALCVGTEFCQNGVCIKREGDASTGKPCVAGQFIEYCGANNTLYICHEALSTAHQCEKSTCAMRIDKNYAACVRPQICESAEQNFSVCHSLAPGSSDYLSFYECAYATDGNLYAFYTDKDEEDCPSGCLDDFECSKTKISCDANYEDHCVGEIMWYCNADDKTVYRLDCEALMLKCIKQNGEVNCG